MTGQEKGSTFEIITKDFFVSLLEKTGFSVTKARVQKAGSQNGFDILLMVSKNYTENKIFIECKNYESDLSIGNILKKGLNLEANYTLDENDLFIAINPRSNFSNEDNSEKLDPILSSKFPFSYYTLDLSNGIKELFALDKKFFKLVYEKDLDFVVDEVKELSRFESIIFSRKPFKKIILKPEDKIRFIGDLALDRDYTERSFSDEFKKDRNFFTSSNLTLIEIVKTTDKLFILGNPGSGKSTELVKLAVSKWHEGEVYDYVPIFKSLKNFSNTDTLHTYLPNKWNELNKILLILDGIDEIADIELFKSKFENFIEQISHSDKQIKFVVSCRTNIYESIVIGLSDFKTFYLQDLTYDEGIDLLKKKCKGFNLANKFHAFLKTPFLIGILADYIAEKNEAPANTANLWKVYIDKRLAHDKKNKLIKITIDPLLIKKYSKKTALVNELMKTNIFEEEHLYSILKENSAYLTEFKKNPLIDKFSNEDKWFFEHRNIQEYFAALVLSELTFEKIKDFIVIKDTQTTHPSLFNTISFLLNIVEGNKYSELVNWLIDSELGLLFKADSDRTGSFKIRVFQEYFKRECIEKGFWISTNKTFSVIEIANFGDCEENLDYLLDIIKGDNNQFRVTISAFMLLNFFTISFRRQEEIKKLFIGYLEDERILNTVKSTIITCISAHNYFTDDNYLKRIFEIFKTETNKEINSALLFLLRDYKELDCMFWYVKEEFLRENKIKERNDPDKISRANNWVTKDLILKFKDSNNFIDLIAYYFNDSLNIGRDTSFASDVLDRFLYFSKNENDFIVRFLSEINGKPNFYIRDSLLVDVIVKSGNELAAASYLLENNPFENVKVLLASIANYDVIELVKEKYLSEILNSEQIHVFRNNLWTLNKELSYKFNSLMLESDFKFSSPFLCEEDIELLHSKNKSKFQNNFDILFDKTGLFNEIECIFKNNTILLDSEDIRKIENKWYENEENWNNSVDSSISLLSTIFDEYDIALDFDAVKKIFEDEHLRFYEIKELIKSNINSNIRFTISTEHGKMINEWCIKASKEIDFSRIIKFYDNRRFNYDIDYSKLNTVLEFINLFDFDLPKEFLLNCLEYFDFDNVSEGPGDKVFGKLKTMINDEELFNKRVIQNLKENKPFEFVRERHINYALELNLREVFPEIREYILSLDDGYNLDYILKKFRELTGDTELLQECCENITSRKCWSAIKILLEKEEKMDFCIAKAIEYLDLKIELHNSYHTSDALQVLFSYNRKEAIVYYASFLKCDLSYLSYSTTYSIEDYVSLEKLFFGIYKPTDRNKFNNNDTFLNAYVSNLSESEEGYNKMQKFLKDIRGRLNNEDHDSELFHLNLLIDHSTHGYINSKSKSMKFERALKKVEEIIS